MGYLNEQPNSQDQETMERFDELEQKNQELTTQVQTLTEQVNQMVELLKNHGHNGIDGSMKIQTHIPQIAESGDIVDMGDGALFSLGLGSQKIAGIAVGEVPDLTTTSTTSVDWTSSLLGIQQTETDSFVLGYGRPQITYAGTKVSVSSGGNSISSGSLKFKSGELAGATIVLLNSSGGFITSREIKTNTSSSITIKETWASSASNCTYFIMKPAFLGSEPFRFNAAYFRGYDISATGNRSINLGVGIGMDGNAAVGIYVGKGVPSGSDNAPAGSLYLRQGGGSGATLYIKEDASTWVAK